MTDNATTRLENDPRYQEIVSGLRTLHGELLKLEKEGKLGNAIENPSLIGDYLGRLRLNANLLFSFLNVYIDVHSDLLVEYNTKRQNLYEESIKAGKSPSAAETHAREGTRLEDTNVKVIENRIQQIKNEYERYNGICMYLQSRLKEFNTERIMG